MPRTVNWQRQFFFLVVQHHGKKMEGDLGEEEGALLYFIDLLERDPEAEELRPAISEGKKSELGEKRDGGEKRNEKDKQKQLKMLSEMGERLNTFKGRQLSSNPRGPGNNPKRCATLVFLPPPSSLLAISPRCAGT